MSAALGVLMALAVVGAMTVWRAMGTMCEEEIRTRLGRFPGALVRLAATRLPEDARADYVAEWTSELDFIVTQTQGLPITRLMHGLSYAGSLFWAARSVARELTGAPRRARRPRWIKRRHLVWSPIFAYIAFWGFASQAGVIYRSSGDRLFPAANAILGGIALLIAVWLSGVFQRRWLQHGPK